MDNFYIKIDTSGLNTTIEVWPFDENNLCNLFSLNDLIKIKSASIQLFGNDNTNSDYDVNLNEKLFNEFYTINHLKFFFDLPFDYSVFELELEVTESDLNNNKETISALIDFNLCTFEIGKGNNLFIRKISKFMSVDNFDFIFKQTMSNVGDFFCIRTDLSGKKQCMVFDNHRDVTAFFNCNE